MRRQNESGYMLVGTILAIVLVMVVGLSLTTLATNSLQTSSTERDNQAVYYIAEAGLTQLAYQFENEVIEIYEDDQVKTEADFFNKIEQFDYFEERYDTFEQVNNVTPYSVRSIEKLEDSYKLISTGFIGEESRTVSQMVEVQWKEKYEEGEYELPPYVVFTTGKITIEGSVQVYGDIGSVSSSKETIKITGNPSIYGKVYITNLDDKEVIVDHPHWVPVTVSKMETKFKSPTLPAFPEFPTNYIVPDDATVNGFKVIDNGNVNITNSKANHYTLNMEDNLKLKSMNFNSNRNLNIHTGDSDKYIIVDHLNMSAGGHIKLLGTGNLTIYVTDHMTFGYSSINQDGDVNRLNIFLQGTGDPNNRKTVNLTNNQTINGSLYAEDADITLSSGTGFTGNIFTGGKSINISGGSKITSQLILAPKAIVNVSTEVKGQIIAEETIISGGNEIRLEESLVLTGPISIEALRQAQNGSGGSGDSAEIETGNKPTFLHSKVREVD